MAVIDFFVFRLYTADTNRRGQGVPQGPQDGEDVHQSERYVHDRQRPCGGGGRRQVGRRSAKLDRCAGTGGKKEGRRRQVAQRLSAVRVRQRQGVHVATGRTVRGGQRESGLPVKLR